MSALQTLKDELDRAVEQHDLCKYIDNYNQMQREKDYWANRITSINEQIAELEGDDQ
jgi:hypothetical protein